MNLQKRKGSNPSPPTRDTKPLPPPGPPDPDLQERLIETQHEQIMKQDAEIARLREALEKEYKRGDRQAQDAINAQLRIDQKDAVIADLTESLDEAKYDEPELRAKLDKQRAEIARLEDVIGWWRERYNNLVTVFSLAADGKQVDTTDNTEFPLTDGGKALVSRLANKHARIERLEAVLEAAIAVRKAKPPPYEGAESTEEWWDLGYAIAAAQDVCPDCNGTLQPHEQGCPNRAAAQEGDDE